MNLTSITALMSLASAAVKVAHDYASVAPSLVKGGEAILANGKTVVGDVEGIISSVKAGHYQDTEAGVAKVLADFGSAVKSIADVVPVVTGVVKQSTSLPSVAGLGAALKAL